MPSLRATLDDQGYVIVPGVVPARLCDAVADVIWKHLDARADDPASWYAGPARDAGMVNIFQHPTMWDIRQHPAVYEAFTELTGSRALWVTVDRLNMKPPHREDQPGHGNTQMVHVDIGLFRDGIPVQGVIALSDTPDNGGSFQCVPGLWSRRDEFLATIPADAYTSDVDPGSHAPLRIGAGKGDLIAWSSLLAHGNSPNTATSPRLAQYVAMYPAFDADATHAERAADALAARPPRRCRSWPDTMDPEPWGPPSLTPLGRKLAGIDHW